MALWKVHTPQKTDPFGDKTPLQEGFFLRAAVSGSTLATHTGIPHPHKYVNQEVQNAGLLLIRGKHPVKFAATNTTATSE